MKNFIYLSIIAVTFLCSCKQGFLTQRYTHYGHSAKNTSQQLAAQKPAPRIQQPETVQNAVVNETSANEKMQEVLATSAVKENSAHNTVAERSVAKNPSNVTGSKYENSVSPATIPLQQMTKKLQKSDAAGAHRGLIFGLMNLALFIIIVAVIVALVIFLVLVVI